MNGSEGLIGCMRNHHQVVVESRNDSKPLPSMAPFLGAPLVEPCGSPSSTCYLFMWIYKAFSKKKYHFAQSRGLWISLDLFALFLRRLNLYPPSPKICNATFAITSWMQSRNAIPPYVSGWNSIAWTWSPLSRVQPGLGSVPATRWKKRLDSPDRASTANRFPINWKASPRLPVCGLRRRDIPKILHCEKGQQESWLINVWFTGS